MPAKHPPRPGTLAWFAECGRPVFIVCNHCGRFVVPKYYEIAQRTGWQAQVADIGPHLLCDRCKQRGARFTLERPHGRAG